MQIRVLKRAQKRLQQIFTYLEFEFGEHIADKFQAEVIAKGESLLKFPESGHPEPLLKDCKTFYRYVFVGKHNKMLYYIKNDIIVIADIWDMRQNPATLQKRIK